jgi:hypothetical protein
VPEAPVIGGSIFVRNAILYGYCLTEALESLYELCDQISILECGSSDGTQELLKKWISDKGAIKQIIYEEGHPWEVSDNYSRLAILANVARKKLTTPWHFMLQADEVLHEKSIPLLRHLSLNGSHNQYMCRRYNLFATPDQCIRLDGRNKPCGDALIRFARTSARVIGDAEGIEVHQNACLAHLDDIVIFHYGYVRDGHRLINKAIDMQSWFNGPGCQPDPRIVKMREEKTEFDPYVFFSQNDLMPIPCSHPKFSSDLAEQLRKRRQ